MLPCLSFHFQFPSVAISKFETIKRATSTSVGLVGGGFPEVWVRVTLRPAQEGQPLEQAVNGFKHLPHSWV